MNSMPDGPILERKESQESGLQDLLEVAACLREMLQTTTDPAALQRLFSLHREIEKYVSELTSRK